MYPTTDARRALAERFGLPYSDAMQDWEWEVADPLRFEEFLAAYSAAELNEEERWSLMEMLVQCVEDMPESQAYLAAWAKVEPLLQEHKILHGDTIQYWARPDARASGESFRVSVAMSHLLSQGRDR